jgi:hydrogenase maturation factor
MHADPDKPLPPGKLPSQFLADLIDRYVKRVDSVVVGPGIGRDAAAIEFGGRILVVKTDPITFATADVGRYLVNVNANDIACMGAMPRWLLVTALLPEHTTTPLLVESIFASLARAAEELGIALVGGHSEITIGIDRPILVGHMLGETDRESLSDPGSAREGDAILLANGIAIEGTAILASAVPEKLGRLPEGMLESARNLLRRPGISVIPAVGALRGAGIHCRYLHDPTEGGLATAVAELAAATHSGVEVDLDAIPILPETIAICHALSLDPMGLIASGALLAVVDARDANRALDVWRSVNTPAARIGTLIAPAAGMWLVRGAEREPLPVFAVDEIARYFASNG